MAEQRVVKLSSASGEVFEVDEAVASQSQFLKSVIEDVGVESPIPLPNVSTQTLQQVLAYCQCYAAENNPRKRKRNANSLQALEEDFRGWPGNAKLAKLVDMENLHGLIMAANYMHIESLLQKIYHTLAMMIAKRTFGEIRQIFNSTKDLARGEPHVIGEEPVQLLASLMDSLPMELQLKIKIKVGQRLHYGEWSPWQYEVDAQTLFVDLANLDDPSNMHHQIAIILLLIDIGLVNTLVLQTCGMMSLSSDLSGETCMEWVDEMDMERFKDLFDGIDTLKIENVIFNEET